MATGLFGMLEAYQKIVFQNSQDQILVVNSLVTVIGKLSINQIPQAIQLLNQQTIDNIRKLSHQKFSPSLKESLIHQLDLFKNGIE